MPLNIKDNESGNQSDNNRMGPPMHKPKSEMSGGTKSTITIIAIAIIIVAAIVLFKSGIFNPKKETSTQEEFTQQTDSTIMAAPTETTTVAQSTEVGSGENLPA